MIEQKKKLYYSSRKVFMDSIQQKKTIRSTQMKQSMLREVKAVTTNLTLTILCQKGQLLMDGVLIKRQINTIFKIGFHFQRSSTIVFFSIKDKV